MDERKKLIGLAGATAAVLLGSVLEWLSFDGGGLNGWMGYVSLSLGPVKVPIQNWLATLSALSLALIIALRHYQVWDAPKKLFFLPAGIIVIHLAVTIFSMFIIEASISIGPGLVIFEIGSYILAMINFKA